MIINAQTLENTSKNQSSLEWHLNNQIIQPNSQNIQTSWRGNQAMLKIAKIDKTFSGKIELILELIDSNGIKKQATDCCSIKIFGKL